MSWITDKPIAHRGLHDIGRRDAPENSIRAFERAVQHAIPIELDIQELRDGEPAVFHDRDLGRMTGVAGSIRDRQLSDLSSLTLKGTDQTIPHLSQVLDFVAGRVPLLIELKRKNAEIGPLEERVAELLYDYNGEVAIQSFNPFSLKWYRENAPGYPRGQLSGDFRDEPDLSPFSKFLLRHLLLNGISAPEFISYDIRCLPAWSVRLRRLLGVPILAWSVDRQRQYERAMKYADNIIFENFAPPGYDFSC